MAVLGAVFAGIALVLDFGVGVGSRDRADVAGEFAQAIWFACVGGAVTMVVSACTWP